MRRGILKLLVVVALCSFTSLSHAADISRVRDYVKKSNFRRDIELGLKQFRAGNQTENYKRFISTVDYAAIEDSYVTALASLLTNEELAAMEKSLSIPGLQEALKKQGQAAAAASQTVLKEIEKAAHQVGMQP